jgi:hypothetical protein
LRTSEHGHEASGAVYGARRVVLSAGWQD